MPHVWIPLHISGSQICGVCETITQKANYNSPDALVKMPVDLLLRKSKIMSNEEKYKLYTCEEIVALWVTEE
jgi:hypothetical protein